MNKIVWGTGVFDDEQHDNIIDGTCYIGNSLAADELSIDTLKATVDVSRDVPTLFCPCDFDGLLTAQEELFGVRPILRIAVYDLTRYKYGEPVYFYHGDTLMGKFYMASTKRIGKHQWEISCTSAIGLLDNSMHYGGLYTGTDFSVILADIIGSAVAYTVSADFEQLPMYGWLPVATRRANLHQLLFAAGASLRKDTAGVVNIVALSRENPTELSDDRLFLGGNVDYLTSATAAAVSEHGFIAFDGDEQATLYNGEVPAEPLVSPKGVQLMGALVLFDSPMHDLVAENGVILEAGVNYAVLGQSADCLLTGKKYTHTTRMITKSQGTASADNTVTVSDATLVSLANSENVAKRVMAYYGSTKLISADVVVGTERPGDPITFNDPFDEQTEGFIQSMDIGISRSLRASATLAAGYIPTGIGNFYTKSAILTGTGLWEVPAGTEKIRVVLIGGGTGGKSGTAGKTGKGSFVSGTGEGGQGGDAGTGGWVYITTLDVTAGTQFQFSTGLGGASDATGGDSLWGEYSSANGRASEKGYAELFGGEKYGLPGTPGIAGADAPGVGSSDGSITYEGQTWVCGGRGETTIGHSSYGTGTAYGGYGGGAAIGSNGGTGRNGTIQGTNAYAEGGTGGIGGQGRAGAKAKGYGNGGSGGFGGGGGGQGGPAEHTGSASSHSQGNGGTGGRGGRGGIGAPGCIIVYY